MAKRQRRKSPDIIVGSLRDVARFFDVHFDTVRTRWRDRGMPGEPGRWDLTAIMRWRNDGNAASTAELRQKKLRAEVAKLEEIVRGKRRANDDAEEALVGRDDCERVWEWWKRTFRKRLAQLPDDLSPAFPEKTRDENIAQCRHMVARLDREVAEMPALEDV